ncbi:MAG: isoamylase early set domain-containing protein [Desulfobacterales bacterium]|nr:isoamylase early set domain-containing protein [Desulfobacterales bacterium]
MKKEYPSKKICKASFILPKATAENAKNVSIVGDFNGWNIYSNPMEKSDTGDYTITLELEAGKEYSFKYLIDEKRWENDLNADKYIKSPAGGSINSVVVV